MVKENDEYKIMAVLGYLGFASVVFSRFFAGEN